MKSLLLFLFCLLAATLFSQTTVTFQVDISGNSAFNPANQQVFLSGATQQNNNGIGTFPTWPMPGTQTGLQLTPITEQLYQVTISNVAPGIYNYKYFLTTNNQATWNLGEWGGTDNRIVVVGTEPVLVEDTWGVITNPSSLNLVVNEIMASNGNTLADEDGDYEDWIELYNAGDAPVNLLGFGISDNPNQPYKWVFPHQFILPNQYLLVWASGKNRGGGNQPLHANFSISSTGEPILLTDNNGNTLSEIPGVPHQADIAFGLLPNASGIAQYLSNPTPGTSNIGPGFASLSQPVQFSLPEGFYTSNQQVTVTTTEENATIRYTLNGDEPTEESPIFTGPITLTNRENEPNVIANIPTNFLSVGAPFYEGWQPPLGNVFKINTLKTKVFNPNTPQAKSESRTYLIHPQGANRYSLPVMALSANNDYLFDNEIGMYVYGNNGNYWEDWERPGNFTYFTKEGDLAFNENAGFQLNGNTTRSRPRKSIRMVFRGMYGNSWLEYPIFSLKETALHKRLILRNGGNDWDNTLFRDAVLQHLAKDFNVETQFSEPTVLFINGEYWGIHNIRDRYSTHYFEAKYGFTAQEITVLENNAEFKRGNPAGAGHYQTLLQFINNNALSEEANYQTVSEMMDIESFIDFQITHIYAKNTDWPGNNVLYWRYINSTGGSGTGAADGRWRWAIFDLDFGFDLDMIYVPHLNEGAAHNTLAFALAPNGPAWPNPAWATLKMRKLIENESFVNQFTNRFCDLLNTVYKPEFVLTTIDSVKNLYQPEMQEHINRWRRPTSISAWLSNVEQMKDFAQVRADFQFTHLKNTFNLGEKQLLTVDVNNPSFGNVQVNTIAIESGTRGIGNTPYPWQGYYLQNNPITVKAKAKPGYVFSHWSGDVESASPVLEVNLQQNTSITAHFIPLSESEFEVLHFWFFGNNLPNNTPLETVFASFTDNDIAEIVYESCLEGYPFTAAHPLWRQASMERRNAPTPLNYVSVANNNISFENSNMRGLQVRQPMAAGGRENTVFLKFSTLGYEQIVLQFAAIDEGAANGLVVDYAIDAALEQFSTLGIESSHGLSSSYQLYQVNFNQVQLANNNTEFVVRIRFTSNNPTANQGNRVTFNNISVSGVPSTVSVKEPILSTAEPIVTLYPNPANAFFYLNKPQLVKEVEIRDITGKLLKQLIAPQSPVDISNLATGTYFVSLHLNSGAVVQQKLIKL
ncbi:MAG: CotH kinase family protein [Luteibaculaceae bacterium]